MNNVDQVREKILSLQTALLEQNPRMPTLLREIHMHLKQDPEVVTLLEDEEIQMVVRGLMKQTATELALSILKSKPKQSLKNITVNDL